MPQISYLHLSVTIRPRYESFQEIMRNDDNILLMITQKLEKYIISEEKGQSDYVNHYQCYFQLKKERQISKYKQSLINILKKNKIVLSPEEIKNGIVIKPVKTNLEGMIGYTLKEGRVKLTNFTQEEQDKYLSIYQQHLEEKSNKYDKANKYRINAKNYHRIIEEYINEHSLKLDTYTTEDIFRITGEMANKGYYFTFLSSRNTHEKLSYVLHYLNKTMEKYIRNLDKQSREL